MGKNKSIHDNAKELLVTYTLNYKKISKKT